MKNINYTLKFIILLFISQAYSAPHPASSSSILTNPEKGLFFERWGFRLGTQGTSWVLSEMPEEGQIWKFFPATGAPLPQTAQIHLRKDQLKMDLSPEAYAKRWIREYGHLGLEILGTKAFGQNGVRGVVIDTLERSKKIQLRQAVYLKGRTVVVLTCSDQKDSFSKTLSDCNQLIKNFSWAPQSRPQKSF